MYDVRCEKQNQLFDINPCASLRSLRPPKAVSVHRSFSGGELRLNYANESKYEIRNMKYEMECLMDNVLLRQESFL
jgi:hypothetical protein